MSIDSSPLNAPEADWKHRAERGNPTLMRLLIWLTLKAGRATGRALLYPICAYFLLAAPAARRASSNYLTRILGRRPHGGEIFRHFHAFASTLLDRIYFLSGNVEQFDIQVFNHELVQASMAQGCGLILLGSHLGSFEVMRTLGLRAGIMQIHMLMYQGAAPKIDRVMDSVRSSAQQIIELDKPGAMLRVKESLEQGAIVGMLGDRVLDSDKQTMCNFLGSPAAFPRGPLQLATIVDAPVVLAFGLYRGGNRYDIHFEAFDSVPVAGLARAERDAAAVQRYAERLEYFCRLAPYNWFNFYEYWHPDAHKPKH